MALSTTTFRIAGMIRALTVILETIYLSSLMDRDEFRCKKLHFYPSLISNALCSSVAYPAIIHKTRK